MDVSDGYAALAYRDKLLVIDVSDPRDPKPISSFDLPPLPLAERVAIWSG